MFRIYFGTKNQRSRLVLKYESSILRILHFHQFHNAHTFIIPRVIKMQKHFRNAHKSQRSCKKIIYTEYFPKKINDSNRIRVLFSCRVYTRRPTETLAENESDKFENFMPRADRTQINAELDKDPVHRRHLMRKILISKHHKRPIFSIVRGILKKLAEAFRFAFSRTRFEDAVAISRWTLININVYCTKMCILAPCPETSKTFCRTRSTN